MRSPNQKMVWWYYMALRTKGYKPLENWAMDGRHANRFLKNGRTFEEFRKLFLKASVGPKELQIVICGGLHRFFYRLPEIELLGEAPWEPSIEERQENAKLISRTADALVNKLKAHKGTDAEWVKNPKGGWMRNPRRSLDAR